MICYFPDMTYRMYRMYIKMYLFTILQCPRCYQIQMSYSDGRVNGKPWKTYNVGNWNKEKTDQVILASE